VRQLSTVQKAVIVVLAVLVLGIAAQVAYRRGSVPPSTPSPLSSEALPRPRPRTIIVQISGGVRNPGVYTVPAGTRVFELVEEAGGLVEGVPTEDFNLARKVSDGERLRIPAPAAPLVLPPETPPPSSVAENAPSSREELGPVAPSPPSAPTPLYDLNHDPPEKLAELPGIGDKLARAIVLRRVMYGPFTTWEDVLAVEGMGEERLRRIQPYVRPLR
jgi:competence protein ComEA